MCLQIRARSIDVGVVEHFVFHITRYLTALNFLSHSRTIPMLLLGLLETVSNEVTKASRKQGKGGSLYQGQGSAFWQPTKVGSRLLPWPMP